MPKGSTVTATSTVAINNARISANTLLITKTTTGLNALLAKAKTAKNVSEQTRINTEIERINRENTNIARINTLMAQLSVLYKAPAFIALRTALNTAQTARDTAIGIDGSIQAQLENQRAQILMQHTCEQEFNTWWSDYKRNTIQKNNTLFTFLSFIVPKAYATEDLSVDALSEAKAALAQVN